MLRRAMSEECPDIEVLAAYAEHKLTPQETPMVEAHLAECAVCRQTVILTVRNKALIEGFTFPDPTGS